MIFSVAPIIHARTENIDFRSKFLAVPQSFSDEDIAWAKSYIVQSTSCFELAGEDGRFVAFSNGKYAVIGMSSYVGVLAQRCGRETRFAWVDGDRTNYAFVGFVFHRNSEFYQADIAWSQYLEEYEKHVAPRWNEQMGAAQVFLPSRIPFQDMEFSGACPSPPAIMAEADASIPIVLDANVVEPAQALSMALELMRHRKTLAFCSDVPNVKCIIEGGFSIVTARNAHNIKLQLQDREKPEDVKEDEGRMAEAPSRRTPFKKRSLREVLADTLFSAVPEEEPFESEETSTQFREIPTTGAAIEELKRMQKSEKEAEEEGAPSSKLVSFIKRGEIKFERRFCTDHSRED